MFLIGGLGNPGQQYSRTRHNVGFMVIDRWAESLGIQLSARHFQSRYTRSFFKEIQIILIRPLTFMNLSGMSIRACADYYDVDAKRVLIIHDDMDLPVGRIRVVGGGGAGGHKGVLSVIHHLGTKDFPRIKIGIGRPVHGEAVEEYVLNSFYRDEKAIIEHIIQTAVTACELFVTDGVEAAMNHTNCQNLADNKLRRD